MEDVTLLSLGTGTSLHHIPRRSLNWGYAQWAKPLVSLMLDGVSGIADFQCRQVLGERYHRLAPIFPQGTSYGMDDVKHVPDMMAFAAGLDIDETVEWLRREWV